MIIIEITSEQCISSLLSTANLSLGTEYWKMSTEGREPKESQERAERKPKEPRVVREGEREVNDYNEIMVIKE